MNIANKLKTLFTKPILALILISAIALSSLFMPFVSAQQSQVLWEGWTKSRNITEGQTEYTDVTNAKPDDVVRVQLWHHNRENPAGPLANNVKVHFSVPTNFGKSHDITGTSSADNAPTISDATTVNTGQEETKVEFIPGSSKFRFNKGAQDGRTECETGFNYPPASCYATVSLPDSVITTGVNLDTFRGGPLRGCNAHHETVIIDVVVKKKTTHPPVSTGMCKVATLDVFADRKVKVTVVGKVSNAEIIGYEIDFGDGTKSNQQSAYHQYEKDGTYRIVTKVNVKYADGTTEWVTSEDCMKSITFEGEKPPVVTPVNTPSATVLPDTGAGDIVGAFMAISFAGMLAYRFVWLRQYN